MKIKNLTIRFLCLVVIALMLPISAFSAGLITDESVNLTISYKAENVAIKNATFKLYRVAEVDPYGVYTLTEEFSESSVDLKGHEAEHWQNVTGVLEAYVDLKNIEVAYKGKTNENGELSFNNMEQGLYLVTGLKRMQGGRTYTPSAFLVALPGLDEEANAWIYSLTVVPKYTSKKDGGGGSTDYVSRKVIKVWDDKDYEHHRPKSISIVLLRDGEAYETVKLNKDNNWKHEWTKLNDKYTWTIAEEEVPEGYKVSMTKNSNTYVITNTYKVEEEHDPKTVSRTVIKIWDDKGYENKRPDEIEVVLLKDGKDAETVKLNETNNWKYEWTGLSNQSEWEIEERDIPAGYRNNVTKDGVVYIITNTYEEEESEKPTEPEENESEKPTDSDREDDEPGTEPPTDDDKTSEDEKVTVSVHKVWNDGENLYRPQSVQLEILKDGAVYETVTVSRENNWQYSLADLPADGVWSVREINTPEGYTSSVTKVDKTFIVTNTIIPPALNLDVTKVWKDEGHESERPRKIEVELLKNGEVHETVTLNENNQWKYEFTGLDGTASWTVREKTVFDKYTSKVVADNGGFVIVNTYSVIPQTGQIWWPVPMLLAIGLMLVLAGLIRRRGAE